MATLSRELRKALEKAVLVARGQAELGARKALEQLAVAHQEPWGTMTPDQQRLRRRLRARGRQLGDSLEERGSQSIDHLVGECAYEQWHRMLFARFLAECGLLIEPDSGVPVSVEECKELSRVCGGDWISLASEFAQHMLPQIFRADDAVLDVKLPAEDRQVLEKLLVSLPADVFQADDSLGWVYQFWQSEEKNRVNESENKIGADELPAVTQLFTEDYMVDFLLHNSMGAWWAGRVFPDGVQAESEAGARAAVALPGVSWDYLRLVQGEADRWFPAAGTFGGWPHSTKDLRILDPCMGSGHFLIAASCILAALRAAEEGLTLRQATAAVLRDNLFGLEIDPRCTQIGAFNVALSAWKIGGLQTLPELAVACSGLGLNTKQEQWTRLAGSNDEVRHGMEALYRLFSKARILGSLIDPRSLGGDLLTASFQELRPFLNHVLDREGGDDTLHELAVIAQGMAKAADILSSRFTLVATNVPYLGSAKQDKALQEHCFDNYPESKPDLATCFIERCANFCSDGGTSALITPQNWLFLGSYRRLRERLLRDREWNCVARLGARAFETITGEVVNVVLVTTSSRSPHIEQEIAAIDVSDEDCAADKARALRIRSQTSLSQRDQAHNPDSRIVIGGAIRGPLLREVADSYWGQGTGDFLRFGRQFWEMATVTGDYDFMQSTVSSSRDWGGREFVVYWQRGCGELVQLADDLRARLKNIHRRGQEAWGKRGVCVTLMSQLSVTRYGGEIFDGNCAAIIPKNEADLPALWAFCSSPEFESAVRSIDQKLNVTNHTLLKVPFDPAHWNRVSTGNYPNGLPKPHSDDPTQWLFDGFPKGSEKPLQVAVARLLGYAWPRQTGSRFVDCSVVGADGLEPLAAGDGIVCISAVKGEAPGADRLGAFLEAAYRGKWGAEMLERLLAGVQYGGSSLEEWMRNGFFQQHCDLFAHRPFIWHIWDGRRDGFSALVNYHKLVKANLEKLTYAYLGDWIRRQEAGVGNGEAGSEARLLAARQLQEELKRILEGEPPYDLFVRWKPLTQQPIGWEPDPHSGVRMSIRPFLTAADVGKKGAGILRAKPNIKWDKDRGKEPSRAKDEFPWLWGWDGKTRDFAGGSIFDGNRWNDLHYSREFKTAARRKKGLA